MPHRSPELELNRPVGRDTELAQLEEVLAAARQGRGRLVVIEAARGMGKTRLLSASADLARVMHVRILRARGVDLERGFSFGVALQLLQAPVASAGETARAELLSGPARLAGALLNGEPDAAPGADDDTHALIHALYWLTGNFAWSHDGGQGLAVLVDDAEAADRPSIRYLAYLAERLTELPVALVIAAQPRAPGLHDDPLGPLRAHPLALRLPLPPLGPASMTELITRMAGEPPPPAFVRACHEATGGNPFLLCALLEHLRADGIDPAQATTRDLSAVAPEGVVRSVLTVLADLPPEARALAHAAAVLSGHGSQRHAAALTGLEPLEVARAADALAAAGILRDVEPLSFAYPLLCSAVVEDLPRAERRDWHARAARLLAGEAAPPLEIADHLLEAVAHGDPWALEVLRAAGRHSLGAGETETARAYFRRALAEPPPPEQRADVLLELAETEAALGDAQALESLAEAVELLDEPRARAEVQRQRGRLLAGQGRHAEAAGAFAEALRELGGADERLARDLRLTYASLATLDRSTLAQGLEALREAQEEIPDSAANPAPALLAQLALRSALAAEPAARVAELAERAWAGGALLEQEGPDGVAWVALATAFLLAGDFESSERVTATVLASARREGTPLAFATASASRAAPAYQLGRIEDAIGYAEQALDARRFGWGMREPLARRVLAHALMDRERLEDAEEALGTADDPALADSIELPPMLEARGRLRLLQGRIDDAVEDYMRAGRLLDGFGVLNSGLPSWRAGAALAYLRAGDASRALAFAERDLEVAEQVGAPVLIGGALRILGLTEGRRGIDHLEQAVATLRDTGAEVEHARALLAWGAALRRASRVVDARAALREAVTIGRRLEMVTLVRTAQVEHGAAGGRSRRTVGERDDLTPSEHRVAELAKRGLTNRQIAHELFVTTKAVEWHLANTYRKLSIKSRHDLARVLNPRVDDSPEEHGDSPNEG